MAQIFYTYLSSGASPSSVHSTSDMTIYGATSVVQVAQIIPQTREDRSGCGDSGQSSIVYDSKMSTLIHPPQWTKAYSWSPAGRFNRDGEANGDLTPHSLSKQGMPSFMESLRLMRAGAINQGVYTMGSMTMDGRHRVEAYIDRWHCRRVAHRYSKGLTLVLHHLAYRVRRRLLAAYLYKWQGISPPRLRFRPPMYILEDTRRRSVLHKIFGAWALLVQWTDGRALQRRAKRIVRLLISKEACLEMLAIERWKRAVAVMKHLEYRKVMCFERWRLYTLTNKHNRHWALERAVKLLSDSWLKHTAFNALVNWRAARYAAARTIGDVVNKIRLQRTWRAWQSFVGLRRQEFVRDAWDKLKKAWHNGKRLQLLAAENHERAVRRVHFKAWLEGAGNSRLLKGALTGWVQAARQAVKERAVLRRFCATISSMLQRRAFERWQQRSETRYDDTPEPVRVTQPEPRVLHNLPASETSRSTVCRCVRCLRKYGRLGGRPNRSRSMPSREGIVVTESACNVNEHLELQLRSARMILNRGLAAECRLSPAGTSGHHSRTYGAKGTRSGGQPYGEM